MKILHNILTRFSRNSSPSNEDVVIISFPKSGRTWLRLMLGQILQQHFNLGDIELLELQDFTRQHSKIPYIIVSPDDRPFWKTVDELETSKELYKEKKVILLVRDPRDVVVSAYFQKNKRFSVQTHGVEAKEQYTGTLSDYLYEPVGSFDTILRFYNIWEENRHVPEGFLCVRYEDMHRHTFKELRRVVNFIGLPEVPDKIITETVEFASFENMRKMEEQDILNSYRLRPDDKTDKESYKVRKGKIGGFVDYLSPDEIDYVNRKMKQNLSDFFGYGE